MQKTLSIELTTSQIDRQFLTFLECRVWYLMEQNQRQNNLYIQSWALSTDNNLIEFEIKIDVHIYQF